MISHFFINRPIFATVLAVLTTLIGAIALLFLPLAQYPRITPPGVSISISYPGANAQVLADAVAAPIEQAVNGVPGMLYMSGQMGNDGTYTVTVTFDIGTDLNTALVMVQNRVALALPQLPTQVQNQGITIRKRTPDILMIVNFISPDGSYDDVYLSNFATIYVKDELLRVPGVSDISYYGERDYSIRAWLNPQKLAACNMTAIDVANAIHNQNIDAPAGQVGQPPARSTQSFQMPIDTLGRLTTPDEFGDIIVKTSLPASTALVNGAPATPQRGSGGLPSPMPSATTAAVASVGATDTSSTTAPSSSTTSTTTSSATTTTSTTTPVMTTTGGASATGGATTGGGGTTGGGASTGGGGTTGGAASGATTGTSDSGTDNTSTSGSSSDSGAGASGGCASSLTSTSGGGGATAAGAANSMPPSPSVGIVRLRDVARIELGALNYSLSCTFDGKPSVGLGIYQLPGTNALDVAQAVQKKMRELKERFPYGVDYQIAYDTTPFIRESVGDVVWTLFEAVALVGLVVLMFLQSWRAVIIPLVAVPVAIISTFAVMAAVNFSLNNISLFGLVLAIGIVVDDAIVVVENVERWMEKGLDARAATRKAMEEVTGPIVAVALVLCAVFVPCAFISGITGQFFRQFAVTIAVSTVFSAINSLTLSPALAAILLKPRHRGRRDPLTWCLDTALGWFFWLFNGSFRIGTDSYAWVVGKLLRLNLLVLMVYGGLLALTYWVFIHAPTGFIPQQDQGRLIVNVQLPDSASLQRSRAAAKQMAKIALKTPGVAHVVSLAGISFLLQANSPNFASGFIVLDSFDVRRSRADMTDTAIMARLKKAWADQMPDAKVSVYGASPIPGLGVAGGFKLIVEDRAGLGLPALQKQTEELVRKLQKVRGLNNVITQFRSKIPEVYLDIDYAKAKALGVSVDDLNQTLDMYMGSLYVNSFNEFGRDWQVTIQADGAYRNRVEQLSLFQVRNDQGQMVPLGTLVQARDSGGPISMTRYNLYTSAFITGNIQGFSTGDAIKTIERTAADTLPLAMKSEWTEVMFLQIRAGNTAMYVFFLSIVSVFLALSALYESWSLPLAVILVVPLCLLCSIAGVRFTNRDVNIFVQIGLVVLVGLACKNAILIVEFAKQMHLEGRTCFDATKEASRLRLRPILMTSFAFIFGVVPLVIASGAGAEMRRSLGTAVFSGMLGVTLFGIFLTPVFFYVIQGLGESRLFASAATRWSASCLAAGLTGGTGGYLLGVLHVVRLPWGPIVGASAGVVIMLGLLEFRRRIAPKLPLFSRNGSPARNGEAAPPRNGDGAPVSKGEGSLGGKQL